MLSTNGVSLSSLELNGMVITLTPEEVQRTANSPALNEIIQAWRFTLFGHIARMDDSIDAKQILTSSPTVDWRPLRQPCITWMKTVQNDLESHKLTWTEAVNLAQNRPLWRLLATSGATHSHRCIPKMTTVTRLHCVRNEN